MTPAPHDMSNACGDCRCCRTTDTCGRGQTSRGAVVEGGVNSLGTQKLRNSSCCGFAMGFYVQCVSQEKRVPAEPLATTDLNTSMDSRL